MECSFKPFAMSKNLSKLSARHGLRENIFDRLGRIAQAKGTPDAASIRKLADALRTGPAPLLGAASFYDFTRPEHQGKKVYVCNGSACQVAGTQDDLREQLLHHFREEEIGEMCCLGRCHENGSFQYQGRNYSNRTASVVERILKGEYHYEGDHYQVKALGEALLTSPDPGPSEMASVVQSLLRLSPEELLSEVHASGLRGRGGAGFPIGRKLESCRQAAGDRKYVVCNADEGDAGSYSDRFLLEKRPYRLLAGMLLTGFIVGAEVGILYIRAEYPEVVQLMEKAIANLHAHGLLGENIRGSGFDFELVIIKAQGAYVCGEETALLASIEGQRPEVRIRPPYPVEQGLFQRPTLVSNVETLANLLPILELGGQRFAGLGTRLSTGTKLLSLNGIFRQPGVYEVPMGTPLATVVNELGGGFLQPVKALHIGGPLGGLVPATMIEELSVDFESFRQHDFLLGHASVLAIPADFPMIEYLEHLFEFAAHESCGKCFPCRLGTTRGHELIQLSRLDGSRIDHQLFADLLETMEQGSLCALGGGMPLPVRHALKYFDEELQPYFSASPAHNNP